MDQPTAQPQIHISNVIYEHEGAIVFDGNAIPSLKTAQEPCVILYLTAEDETNGFGTVIRLDPQTKQAAIFPDLNPEYTYLFYKDDQGHLQTLLKCIEFASRTETGQFIAHAKVHGQGLNSDELNQAASQLNQPAHSMAEAYTPSPTAPSLPTTPSPIATPAIQPNAQPQVIQPAPTAAIAGEQVLPFSPSSPPTLPTPPMPQDVTQPPVHHLSLPPQPVVVNTDLPEPEPTVQMPVAAPIAQPTTAPEIAPDPTQSAQPDLIPTVDQSAITMPAPLPMQQPDPVPTEQMVAPVTEPSLPPTQPDPSLFAATPNQPIASDMPLVTEPPTAPEQVAQPVSVMPTPDQAAPVAIPTPTDQPKNPVGRPPKPLIQDTAWVIEPTDFSWLKTMSRQPIASFKEELYEKIVHQIRTNQPDLIDNWHFNNKLEQAFNAICLTYDLVPTSRQDLLRSLLNGRIVKQVHQQLEAGS